MNSGFIKLYRSLLEHTVWDDPPACRVFMYLLLAANHKPSKMTVGNGRGVHVIDVARGEAIIGIPSLSKRTKISKTSVQRALQRLEAAHNVIVQKAGSHCTRVTIVNYDSYQSTKSTSGLASGSDRVRIGLASGTSKNDKNDKNEKKDKNKDMGAAPPPPPVLIPDALNTEAFRAAWSAWSRHRSEIRKPLKPSTTAMQLKTLAALGPAQAVACIELSITNGWTGLFPERFQSSAPAPIQPARRIVPDKVAAAIAQAHRKAAEGNDAA